MKLPVKLPVAFREGITTLVASNVPLYLPPLQLCEVLAKFPGAAVGQAAAGQGCELVGEQHHGRAAPPERALGGGEHRAALPGVAGRTGIATEEACTLLKGREEKRREAQECGASLGLQKRAT